MDVHCENGENCCETVGSVNRSSGTIRTRQKRSRDTGNRVRAVFGDGAFIIRVSLARDPCSHGPGSGVLLNRLRILSCANHLLLFFEAFFKKKKKTISPLPYFGKRRVTYDANAGGRLGEETTVARTRAAFVRLNQFEMFCAGRWPPGQRQIRTKRLPPPHPDMVKTGNVARKATAPTTPPPPRATAS